MRDRPDRLITLGYKARGEGRLAYAKQLFLEAVASSRTANTQAKLARSLTGLGQIERAISRITVRHFSTMGKLQTFIEACLIRLAHTVRHIGDILRNDGYRTRQTLL